MSKVKENVKLGTIIRETTRDNVLYSEMPDEAFNLLGRYIGRYCNYVTRISYNGGGKLVNYGLNIFVRDIYMIDKQVAYSDRFGRYKYIIDEDLKNIIATSKLFITAEGVLLFYNKKSGNIYATLDCKVGYLFNVSSFENEGFEREKFSIEDISIINKRTYIKVLGKDTNVIKYYLLNFSFNLYGAYSPQVKIDAVKVDDVYVSSKSIEESEKYNTVVTKIDKIKKLKRDYYNVSTDKISEFIEVSRLYSSNKEEIKDCSNCDVKVLMYDGESGINDCINAFTKNIVLTRPNIITFKGFFKKEVGNCYKSSITTFDRFGKRYTSTNISISAYNSLKSDTSLACVSSEGVIVVIDIINYDNIQVLLSLDGIIWKEYNIAEFIKNKININDRSEALFVSFECKNGNNYLKIFKKEYNDDKTDYKVKNSVMLLVDFTFNFWELYGSPVEASFTLAE